VVLRRRPVMVRTPLLPPATARPAIVANPGKELRLAGIAAARVVVSRRSSFHGWLQTALLRKHALTSCGCGLINCR
jgi:hypothetical protein